MGVNLSQIGQALGIGGNPHYASPSAIPQPGVGPRALLGPVAVDPDAPAPVSQQPVAIPETVAPDTESIQVSGRAPSRMSPAAMGMPGLEALRPTDPEAIADIRQGLKDKAEMARQIYHKNSQFGTKGILRDIIGNAEDFGRRLLGFAPRYNQEKWTERAYGMTSSDPAVRAAATEQAMQYNPELTSRYRHELEGERVAADNSQTNAAYRATMNQQRASQILSGFGQGILNGALGQDPAQANALYQRARPAIQAQLDSVYGEGAMEAPAEYDEGFLRQLSGAGYSGSNVQRERASVLSSATQRSIAQMRSDTQRAVAAANNETRVRVAQIMASTQLTRAQQEAEIRRELGLAPTVVTETESGSVIHPTKTRTTTRGQAAPAAPQYRYYNGKRYMRGPNGEAVEAPE